MSARSSWPPSAAPVLAAGQPQITGTSCGIPVRRDVPSSSMGYVSAPLQQETYVPMSRTSANLRRGIELQPSSADGMTAISRPCGRQFLDARPGLGSTQPLPTPSASTFSEYSAPAPPAVGSRLAIPRQLSEHPAVIEFPRQSQELEGPMARAAIARSAPQALSSSSWIGLPPSSNARGAADRSSAIENFLDRTSVIEKRVKYIFFIRHGESRWNVLMDSLKGLNLFTAATSLGETSDVDHPLSDVGAEQAEELRSKIQAELETARKGARQAQRGARIDRPPEEDRFYSAFQRAQQETVLCSPMRRALQTANRALSGKDGWSTIYLIREAKELRNFAWELDCGSTSDNVGTTIVANAELGPDAARVDTRECGSQWWNDAADTEEEKQSQLSALWERLTSDQLCSRALVTHSNVIRMLSGMLAEKCAAADCEVPPVLDEARSRKLRNCGVLGMRVASVRSEWIVEDARLLFDSAFEGGSSDDASQKPSD